MTASSGSSAVGTAKELAPWRSGLAWWIILVEGIVLAVIGLIVILDPQGASQNLALTFTAALAVAGLLQLWAVFRHRVPETLDSLVSGRAAIAVFAGLVMLLLRFLGHLTLPAGLIIVGLASLLYGLLGLVLIFKWDAGRRVAIIEMIFFILVGVLMLYAQLGGTEELQTAITIIGWSALLAGAALIAFAFYRRNQPDATKAAVEDGAAQPQPSSDAALNAADSAEASAPSNESVN